MIWERNGWEALVTSSDATFGTMPMPRFNETAELSISIQNLEIVELEKRSKTVAA